jgi:hypothetical protein
MWQYSAARILALFLALSKLTRSPFQNTDNIVTNRDFSLVEIMINNLLQVLLT